MKFEDFMKLPVGNVEGAAKHNSLHSGNEARYLNLAVVIFIEI